jgi:hypothetical protein
VIRLYLLASVPGGPSGPFYDVFRKGSGLWRLFSTSAEENSLVSDTWIEERAEEWGTGSPLYIARVLGQFPEEDEGVLYRLSDIEAAVDRVLDTEGEYTAFGVDVARFGADASALAVWTGKELVSVETRRQLDTMAVAAWVASEINRSKPKMVAVDEIGLGSGVVDRLRMLGHYNVMGVNVGSAAHKKGLYFNRRAEIAWRFREALEKGEVSLPDDERLVAELSSMRFEYTARGQIKLEEKSVQLSGAGTLLHYRRGRAPESVTARLWATRVAPGRRSERAVAAVVNTSSTRTRCASSSSARPAADTRNAPATLAARSRGARRAWRRV